MKRIIGLTGGIATGKSTVANYLAGTYKLPILDADMYARDAVGVGSPILTQIAQRYSHQNILLASGELNRTKLGEIIFTNLEKRLWVESLIHPYVKERFNQEIAVSPSNILVLVIPLLFEVEMTDLTTEIWVVSCSESQQVQRLMQRNNLTLEQAQARIKSQMPIAEKIARADVVLDNSQNLETLLKQVDKILFDNDTVG
ncbi:dephospho-CoA kinase [Calothrix sp. NIES-4071]|nr:dephospho-CoA kinase [Calothrix sp. NIES-4071]BAZ60886.1 dephospho-CoA kinase [Calothrix sp. NIES-4105]